MTQSNAALALPAFPPEKLRAAADLVEGLDARALNWLSGYLAGAAAERQRTPANAPALDGVAGPAHPLQLTILYGSQTGNAKRIAEQFAARVTAAGLAVRLVRADAYRTGELKKERFLYLVISTHSEGDKAEPPDDSRGFFEFLMGKRAPRLADLHYAVLALGDSSYADFCGIGRVLDQRLAEQGATRLIPLAEADVDIGRVSAPWAEQAFEQARRRLDTVAAPVATTRAVVTPLRAVPQAWTREHPFAAEVLVNQRIVGTGSGKDVRHIELSLQGSGLHYEPGDALGVWPTQTPELVARIVEVLGLDPAAPVRQGQEELPLEQWLRERRELTVLTRPFVKAHAERGHHSELLARLEAAPSGTLAELQASHQLVDLLRTYSTPWEAAPLVAALRPLAPRLYSIASSQAVVDEEVHLTVARLAFERDGEARWGAGSRYLCDLTEGSRVSVFVEPNERFHLPADSARDVIMVGPGTGVAPFRAFLQQRHAAGATGRNWLFFGNPHRRTDFLYQIEWRQALKEGGLTHLDVAFSRDQPEKVYVQLRLRQHGAELWRWLAQGAYFYVCGDAQRMAPGVKAALLDIAVEHGGKSTEAATQWFDGLVAARRYARDVY